MIDDDEDMSRKPRGSSSPFYDHEFAHTPLPKNPPDTTPPIYRQVPLSALIRDPVYVCTVCSAMVMDIHLHDDWHQNAP